jgi:selenocysteine-specific elongation factor
VLAEYGQRFILRQLSPVVTIGGGRILDPAIPPFTRLKALSEYAELLGHDDPGRRLAGFLEQRDLADVDGPALARRLGIDPDERDALVADLRGAKKLLVLPRGVSIHRARRDALAKSIIAAFGRELKRRQPLRSLERATLLTVCRRLAPGSVVDAMIDDLLDRQLLVKVGDRVGLPGQRASLTKQQQQILAKLLDACRQGGLGPPLVADFSRDAHLPIKDVELLARVAVEDDLLVRVGDGFFADPQALGDAARRTADHLHAHGPATVAQLRDLWGVSRKYAVPLCEYFDAIGVTRRSGDLREPGTPSQPPPVA